MSYQTPPQFTGGQPSPASREIDFGIISDSFQLLTRHWQPYCTAGAVSFVAILPSQIVGLLPTLDRILNPSAPVPDPFATLGLQYGLMVPGLLINLFMAVGVIKFTLNVLRGNPADPSDVWEGFRDVLGYFAVSFLSGLVTMLGMIACCIGFIFTGGLMMFAIPHKVATRATASDSVSTSWSALKGQWAMAGVFFLVIVMISGLGSIACGVGQIFTYSFEYIAATMLYCRFMGIQTVPAQNPASPYPRGGNVGYGIGEGAPPAPERPSEPPKPEDMG